MIALSDGPIDVAAVTAAVADPGHGAVLTFSGVTRQDPGAPQLDHLHYEAWPTLAVPEMQAIAAEAVARWSVRVAVVHRVGDVPVGEASVVIAVGAGHRGEGYEASRYVIDELKRRVPVWKKEVYASGDGAWIANRP